MAEDAKVVVSIETILRGLEKTVKGIDSLRLKLDGLSKIKAPALSKISTANIDKAATASHKAAVRTQELANRQERARQSAERLSQANARLAAGSARLEAAKKRQAQATERASTASGKAADAHVKEFRALERVRVAQERFERQSVAALQRQRSSALIKEFNAQQKASSTAARTRERDAKRAADAEIREAKRAANEISQSRQRLISGFRGVGSAFTSAGVALAAGLTAPLAAFGIVATRSAKDIDAIRNRLIATEGSLEAANARLAELRQLADQSVGVTRRSALDAFATLSVVGDITDKTIERQIKALGRLNAAFTIDDQQQFFRNLIQIFTQGFERADVKEAIGRVPIFNQLLQTAFGTADPEKLRDLKAAGKLTLDGFLAGFAGAVEGSSVLQKINQSIGVRLAKSFERITDALEPLGAAILQPLERIITRVEPLVQKAAAAFKGLSPQTQELVVGLGLIAAAAGPVLIALGSLLGIVGSVTSAISAFGTAAAAAGGAAALLSGVGEVLLVIAAAAAVVAAAALTLKKAWDTNFGGIRDTVNSVLTTIQDGFNRVLPNLLSLTEKVTKGIHAFWNRFGPAISNIVETVFGNLTRRLGLVINAVTEMVVIVTKLIDGDWRGAWEAFSRIVELAAKGIGDFLGTISKVVIEAVNIGLRAIESSIKKFAEAGTKLAKNVTLGFAAFFAGNEASNIAVTALLGWLLLLPLRVREAAFALGRRMAGSVVEGFVEGVSGAQGQIPSLTVSGGIDPEVEKRNREQIEKALGQSKKTAAEAAKAVTKGATAIRNAQEALNQARAERQKAADDDLVEQERIKNERLLQENENAFRLQQLAYEQYLNERARLTGSNIQLEIDQQQKLADQALAERDRLLARATAKGIPKAERLRSEAGAEEADARRIQSLTTINRLVTEQRALIAGVKQALAEAQLQQEKDVRQLQIEYAELTGRIEEALNAATDVAVVDRLKQLALAQDDLNKRLQLAKLLRDADAVAQIKNAQAINQAEIELIENKVTLERATNQLAVAERFVSDAKEKQGDLERQIAFDVEFRGLREEEAIRRRLAGEEALRKRLLISREIIQDTVNLLVGQGVKPPQALVDFIKNIELAMKGLGELSFTEQFRLAQQEFERINDERIQKIQEVERAVRNRTLAEVEGQILVRRINGEYVADLEKQAELLRSIAAESGQRDLQRQAQQAGDATKDASDQLASFSEQIESAGKDAFRSGLSNFFSDILNRTKSAKEAFLDFIGSIAQRVNDVIAENLAQGLFESIFGTGEEGQGILARIRGLFGGAAPEEQIGQVGAGLGSQAALQTAATTAAASLTTGAAGAASALGAGGATASAAMTAGGTTAGTAMATSGATVAASLTASAAAFSAAVIAAGAAFAAAVAASTAAQTAGGIAGSFASGGQVPINVSKGELYVPPKPVSQFGVSFWNALNAKRLRLSQAAAVLRGPGTVTSDSIPAFAPSGSYILRADAVKYYSDLFLRRISSKRFAEGGFVSSIPDGEMGGAFRGGSVDLKQVLVDARNNRLADFLSTAEDRQMMVDFISDNRSEIRRILKVREA